LSATAFGDGGSAFKNNEKQRKNGFLGIFRIIENYRELFGTFWPILYNVDERVSPAMCLGRSLPEVG
jgi:hypothetical protein